MTDSRFHPSRTDLARAVGVTPKTLRAWEAAGLIPAPERISGRLAQYAPEHALLISAFAEARADV